MLLCTSLEQTGLELLELPLLGLLLELLLLPPLLLLCTALEQTRQEHGHGWRHGLIIEAGEFESSFSNGE